MTYTKRTTTRIMVVDRSEVARSMISHILQKEMKDAYCITCGSAEEALEYLHREKFDLVTTSLLLPGLDGLDLCHEIRQSKKQHLTPVIVVSSDADTRLLREGFSAGVTDYFNKSLGYKKLVEFIKDVAQRHAGLVGRILYVEDSPSTAQTTKAVMEKHGLHIIHVASAEEALQLLKKKQHKKLEEVVGASGFDIIFTDFFLKGQMTGGDLLYAIRTQLHYSRQEMPVLVITVEDNKSCQADIFHAGANDFVMKPVIEEVLIARIKSLLLIKHQYNVLQRNAKMLHRLLTTDILTGTYNKKFLLEEGTTFIEQHSTLCMMMIDIDELQAINDAQGHLVADRVLQTVGDFLNRYFSTETLLARFAGKKFTALIPHLSLHEAKALAEKLHHQIAMLKPENLSITASIGLTVIEGASEINLAALIARADSALYKAQRQGRNQICIYTAHQDGLPV